MATWVDWTTTSNGGNISLRIAGGYANVTRSGNRVTGNLGLRFYYYDQWTSNSVVGKYNGTTYYAQKHTGGSGSHASSGDVIYCKSDWSQNGYNTTESCPWSFSATVSGSGSGTITISMDAGWVDWAGNTQYSYSFTVPYPALPTYTVSYAANGGSSTPNSQTKTQGESITLRSGISRNSSTASGYTVSFNGNGGIYSGSSKTATNTTTYSFNGWKSNNSGTVYNGGASYNEDGNNTMTAQWSSSTSRGSITLPNASAMSRTYYTFIGWNTNSSGTGTDYSGGASYTPSSNTTLYAKWVANAPYGLNLTYSNSTTNSITLNYTDNGVVTHRMALYRKANTGSYSSMSIDSGSFTISGLEPDTNYEVYYIAGNSDNQGVSSVKQFSTLLTNPTISDVVTSDLNPFGVTLTVSASIDPQRTLSYQFSNDGGVNWTASQSSEIYAWENLNEETTYSMFVKVIAAHLGTNASDTTAQYSLSITTPADQAKIRIKDNGTWKKGKMWYKTNGEWTKAKKVYIKVNGEWVIGYNYENN